MLTVTPIYVAVAVVFYSVLSISVIRGRYRHRISLGDGAEGELRQIVRAHANFAEYAPLALLAIGVAELSGAPSWTLHTSGLALLTGRAIHAYCFAHTKLAFRPRVTGMLLTFAAMWIAAGACLWGLFV